MSNRRIKETIGIRYDDVAKMEVIIADVKKMLKEQEEITKQDEIYLEDIKDFSLKLNW